MPLPSQPLSVLNTLGRRWRLIPPADTSQAAAARARAAILHALSRKTVRALCWMFPFMKTGILRHAAALSLWPWLRLPVLAQTSEVAALKEVVITATRIEQPVTDVVADVGIIDHAEMSAAAQCQSSDLSRLLVCMLPSNGDVGRVYVRGADSRMTHCTSMAFGLILKTVRACSVVKFIGVDPFPRLSVSGTSRPGECRVWL